MKQQQKELEIKLRTIHIDEKLIDDIKSFNDKMLELVQRLLFRKIQTLRKP